MNHRLTETEKRILSKMLSVPFVGADALRKQLETAQARPTGDSDNYGSIYLATDGEPAPTSNNLPVEASTHDADEMVVDLLLHVKDGRIFELEIIKLDGTPLISPIDPETLAVTTSDN